MEKKHSKDDIAQHLYGPGRTYSALSAWGQNKVDHLYSVMYPAPTQPNLRTEATLRSEALRLASQLEHVRMENDELWHENTELKTQLAELQSTFNPPFS